MSDMNPEDVKELEHSEDCIKGEVDRNFPKEDPEYLDKQEDNPMLTPQEEVMIRKKYRGLLPKKPPLISKDHERAFFDSADWALGKPTPHQQTRSRRSAYAPPDDGEGEDGGNNNNVDSEDQS